jgi:mannose-6-phosphate isomerase-like protein (cupin superfamily)
MVAPIGRDLFFDRYWGREYLYIRRNSADYYDDILRIEDIDRFLESEQLPAAFVNVVTDGTNHPEEEWSRIKVAARGQDRVAIPDRLFALYREGATLILNQAHRAIPALSLACRELFAELGFPARANIYITPPNSQGFSWHADDHEILILAISGRKSFYLRPAGGETVEVDLRAGDLLYLPRGLVHQARSSSVPAVHLSMGLKPLYGFHLVEELAVLARQNPDFQTIVPDRAASRGEKETFEKEFSRRLLRLIEETSGEMLAGRCARARVDGQSTGWPGRFRDLLRLDEMTGESIIAARTGIVTLFEEDEKNVHVSFAGKHLTVPKFLKLSLERILEGSPVAIREIPGLIPPQGKVEFTRPLVESGLVSIVKL